MMFETINNLLNSKSRTSCLSFATPCLVFLLLVLPALAQETANSGKSPPLEVADSEAANESEMKPYEELIEHVGTKFKMLPIPSGKFMMSSPEGEADRREDEGSQREVEISAFWMGATEITWDVYDGWAADMDLFRMKAMAASA